MVWRLDERTGRWSEGQYTDEEIRDLFLIAAAEADPENDERLGETK